MIHNIPFEIQPFAVPLRIVATPAFRKPASPTPLKGKLYETPDGDKLVIPLGELDYNTLDKLCNEFRESVFAQAGIKDKARMDLSCLVQPVVSDPRSIDF